jgi:hypothetical protein
MESMGFASGRSGWFEGDDQDRQQIKDMEGCLDHEIL